MLFFVVMCTLQHFNPVAESESERRPLAQFPENITWETIFNTKDANKSTIKLFEKYTVDQFPFREFFRSVKANFQLNVLGLKENNGLAVKDGYIVKIETDFTKGMVDHSLSRLEAIYDTYLKDNGGDKFISIIPDKNYFLGKDYGYPAPDYEWLIENVKQKLPDVTYIDIFDTLSLSDYYRTDTHWSQDKILGVADRIGAALGVSDRLSGSYKENVLEGFRGVYYGQSALNPSPDKIVYLTNDILDFCRVYDYETGRYGKIYNKSLFEGKDGYDFFLSGTRALLRIDNPNATTDEELIIFRDSFGSSFSPLLAEAYKSIYIVDIRYIAPAVLPNYIDFDGKDVLFLYSSTILNSLAFK